MPERHILKFPQKIVFEGVFVYFFDKGRPYFDSNAIYSFFLNLLYQDFLKYLHNKENFCWKASSKNIYTFYLKCKKNPFCAPIFHPISETESYSSYRKQWRANHQEMKHHMSRIERIDDIQQGTALLGMVLQCIVESFCALKCSAVQQCSIMQVPRVKFNEGHSYKVQ